MDSVIILAFLPNWLCVTLIRSLSNLLIRIFCISFSSFYQMHLMLLMYPDIWTSVFVTDHSVCKFEQSVALINRYFVFCVHSVMQSRILNILFLSQPRRNQYLRKTSLALATPTILDTVLEAKVTVEWKVFSSLTLSSHWLHAVLNVLVNSMAMRILWVDQHI